MVLLCIVLGAALSVVPKAAGVTPLSSWQKGIATNYGGAQDGLSPDQPSFGTLEVSLLTHDLSQCLTQQEQCA